MQTTIRDIPEDLEDALRERARRSGESLNRTMVRLLREAVGLNPPRRNRDLSALAGTWSREEADEFDRQVRSSDQIDGSCGDDPVPAPRLTTMEEIPCPHPA